jgi:hypothetical protein
MIDTKAKAKEDDVIDLTDSREYPNQKNMLRDIAHIYQHLTPANKKLVRLVIARQSKE